jgi:hypothetical protein
MEAEVVVVVGDGDAAVAAIAGEEVPHRHVRQRGDGEREDERWIEAASVAAAKDAGREGGGGGLGWGGGGGGGRRPPPR